MGGGDHFSNRGRILAVEISPNPAQFVEKDKFFTMDEKVVVALLLCGGFVEHRQLEAFDLNLVQRAFVAGQE